MSRAKTDLSQHPVGLVPSQWLADRLNMSFRTIAYQVETMPTAQKAPKIAMALFPRRPSTFSAWVTAWGVDRVLAWLDEYASEQAAYVRANIDRLHDVERDEAEAREAKRLVHLEVIRRREARLGAEYIRTEKRNAARKRQEAKVAELRGRGLPVGAVEANSARARVLRDAACQPHPCGLVPDMAIETLVGVAHERVKRFREDHGVDPFANRRNYVWPEWYGAWTALISAWGPERSRAWVAQHAPKHTDSLERDMRPPAASGSPSHSSAGGRDSRRGAEWRKLNTRIITAAIAERDATKDGIDRDAAFMRQAQVTPSEKNAREPAGRVETVEEWLARGGRVTRLVGAGNANVGEVQA